MSSPLEVQAPVVTMGPLKDIVPHIKSLPLHRLATLSGSVIGVGLAIYFIYNFVYNVFFHPYAKYPGPFLAKFTDLYSGYHAWKGDIHLDMWRCHEKYGDKVRYAPNRLNINTVTGLKSKHVTSTFAL
jgi:hypothetical protein